MTSSYISITLHRSSRIENCCRKLAEANALMSPREASTGPAASAGTWETAVLCLKRWLSNARPFVYWTLWAWLLLFFWGCVNDIAMVNRGHPDYRQLYYNLETKHAVDWAFALLCGAALAGQAVGFRTRRFSWIALVAVGAFLGFSVADSFFTIVQTCC